jgi:hypothetical protein
MFYSKQSVISVSFFTTDSARCELTCKASGHGFYNSFPDPIINGTICNKDGSSVCVEGVCKV